MLYKGLMGKASIPTADLIPLVRRCGPCTDIFKCDSPKTIRDWRALPDSLISSSEGAEDGVLLRVAKGY